jgi:transketolase
MMEDLKNIARTLRKHVICMTGEAGSGHPGGSLSAADIMTVLYFSKMRIDPKKPDWEERDRFVLCKGHAAPVYYAALAEKGFFPVDELKKLRKLGSILQGHPCVKTPGVDVSTGSLGQGLSMANGMALAGKLDKKPWRVYALLGDGECQEGQVWEAAMLAANYKLDNLTAILDRNGLQIDGPTEEVMAIEPLEQKWAAFGWNVLEIDGNDISQVQKALDDAESLKGAPTIIIANTTKGKGVRFMEGKACWHGRAPKGEEVKKALEELE